MGMLDDAIRQHLELKRRSGAPDDEVERLETEAFGPARREPAIAAPVDQPEADELPPPPGAAPAAEEEPPPPERDSWLDDADDEDIPEPEMPTVIQQQQPTSEFTADEAREAEGAPQSDYVAPDEEGDDLLEETPEFLQETPEHDRLWFEQKPPRGFDFDQ
jgi:hypothetical protein